MGKTTKGDSMSNKPKVIRGIASEYALYVDGKKIPLAQSLKIREHSPTGFNWGYGGSGPSQTALAICLLYLDAEQAQRAYQYFKQDLVSTLPQGEDFVLNGAFVEGWIEAWKNSTRRFLSS